MIESALKRTPLHDLHLELGAKMVPFAGYDMPVQYPTGILTEHLQTRAPGGAVRRLAYGPAAPHGEARGGSLAAALERVVTSDIAGLAPGRTRYALFTNESGGILDDLMVTNTGDHLILVVNAACKEADEAHLRAHISEEVEIENLATRALLALQGPAAVEALGAAGARLPGDALHDRRLLDHRGGTLLRHPLGLYRRGRLRDLRARRCRRGAGAAPAGHAGGEAHRPRRAGFPAARGGSLPLWP